MTRNAKFTHNLVKRQCAEVEVGRCGMRRDGIGQEKRIGHSLFLYEKKSTAHSFFAKGS